MIKYTVDGSGIVNLIHNEMSVEKIVETLLKQDYIIELFEGDVDAAKEEVFLVASETQQSYEYIDGYFRTLYKRCTNK